MPYVLTVEVTAEGAATPTRSVITFDLPAGGTDADAVTVAKGVRKGFRDAYDTRVTVVSFQQTGLTRDVGLPG